MSKSYLLSRARVCALAGCLALLWPLASYAQYEISDEDATTLAKKFAKRLINGKFEDASELCGDEDQKKFANELKEKFEKNTKELGKFKSFGPSSVEALGDRKLVSLPTHFANGFLQLNILVDPSEKVIWIKYQSVGFGKAEEAAEAAKPATDFKEKDVTFGKEPWEVKGRLTLPKSKKPVPVVLLVQGSGPRDEDGTIGANKPFADLAQGLAGQGIAVLRYPNRTLAYQEKLSEQKNVSVREEMVDDVIEALKFLRDQKGIDKSKIYLLGIGFGGSLSAHVAQEDKNVAGVVVMASSPRNIADALEARLKYMASLPGPQQAELKKRLDQSSDMFAKLRDGSAPADGQLLGQPVSRWKDMNEYSTKTAERLAGLDCRILIAGAGRDFEITRADFDMFKKALKDRPKAKFKWYKEMNHYFVRGTGKSTPQEYEEEAHVDPVVIEQLGKWIKFEEGAKE